MKKIIDAHTHVYELPEGIKQLINLADHFGYGKVNILSAPSYLTILQNIEIALCKKLYPNRAYIFGGLEYETEALQLESRSFLNQAKKIVEMGFDGFKIIEGKPSIRKKINRKLNDSCYDDFYSYLEQNNLPVLMHIADPKNFWLKATTPEWGIAAGYCYEDGDYLPYQSFYDEVDGILQKYPKLKVILAHFYFLSDNIKAASEFLDKWENASFDLTPGTEMYVNFTKDYDTWRAFFIKYQDRIIFGTDSSDVYSEKEEKNIHITNHLEMNFISKSGNVNAWELNIKGMCFEEVIQNKIFAENFLLYVNEEPISLNDKAVLNEIEQLGKIVTDKSLLEKLNLYKSYFL